MPNIAGSVRRALVLSFAQRYTGLVFSIASVLIVSHLLTPAQIGVFSVAAGLTALVGALRDFGVTEYVVQEKSLNTLAVHTAFTVTLVTAWMLAAALFLASAPIGRLYGDSGVSQVVRVLSISLALIPFGSITIAILRRNFEFGALYKISLGENLTRSGLTIGLAYAGFSYMSMAWASLAAMIVNIAGCTVWGWRYRVRGLSFSKWREVLPFGSKRIIVDIVGRLGEQSANVIVGKMLGMADAGFYSRGYGVINMFRDNVVRAIGAVAFPALARAHRQQDGAPVYFLNILVHLTGICWPFFSFAAIMAPSIIFALFGSQWAASVPIMRWLCVAAIFGTLIYQCSNFLTAVGRVGALALVETQYQLARLGLAIAAAFYSLEAVAASQIPVYIIAIALYYRKFRGYAALRPDKVVTALLPSAVITIASCVVPATVSVLWPHFVIIHSFLALILATAGAGVGWLIGVRLTKHPLLLEMKQAASSLHSRLPGQRGSR